MPNYSFRTGAKLDDFELLELQAPYASRFARFYQGGYSPHYWQILFHTATNPETGTLSRYRHLVAGRRGGKTYSAAEEVKDSVMNPEDFHWFAHQRRSKDPLHAWILTKDHKVGRAPLLVFRRILERSGLRPNIDYKENRGDLYFEFKNGSLVEFKTAVDPQSLRGAGLDLLWMDEAAFVRTQEAYDVATPALDDKLGLIICTTTPDGRNWYYDLFWNDEAMVDPDISRVEYRSIDNPYFPRKAWEYRKKTYHPLLFKQEYEASFDSMAGKELPGDWITQHFYTANELPWKEGLKPDAAYRNCKLDLYLGVDPAISLSDNADHFCMALLGVDEDKTAFILETFKGRLPFAEQVETILSWHHKYRPTYIGIEAQAYQASLAQQVQRSTQMPPVIPMLAKGKKFERILSMSMLFKIGKVRVKAEHRDFIEEWLNYDSSLRNPKDDLLDATEISLRTAGALLPEMPAPKQDYTDRAGDLPSLVKQFQKGLWTPSRGFDEHMGEEW